MYTPSYFSAPAKETLLKILPAASFAILITPEEDGTPFVSHLPLSYDADKGAFGSVRGHLARANPHVNLLATRPSLMIFSGPHLYVSPRDYASNINVPTWNYIAVHGRGQAVLMEDPADTRRVLAELTAENEAFREAPWNLADIDEKRTGAMMKAIAAFEIPLTSLEAKVKLGQNKKPEDRAALAHAAQGTNMEEWQKSTLSD